MIFQNSDGIRYYNSCGLFEMPLHSHSSVEINFVTCGIALYNINGADIPVKKGEILLLRAEAVHKVTITKPETTLISFELDLNDDNREILCRIFEKGEVYYIIPSTKLIDAVLDDLTFSLFDKEEQEVINNGILYLFGLLRKSVQSRLVKKIKTYIINNFRQIYSLEDVSNHFHFSKSYIQSIFKRETGRSIGGYINDIKMNNACYLLSQTEIPVCDIDKHIGLRSRQAFYHLFKETYNLSPKKYRSHFKN